MQALIIMSVLLVITLGVGLAPALSKKAQQKLTVSEYFIGSRSLGPVIMFFTTMATWYSSSVFLGAVAEVYTKGLEWVFGFTSTALAGLVFFLLAPRIQKLSAQHDYVTQADFFEHRFRSPLLGALVSLVGIVCMVPYITIQIVGTGIIFELFTGGLVPFWLGALIGTLICAAFVFYGGMKSVAWTDVLLGIIFLCSIWFVVLLIMVEGFGGGFGVFFTVAAERFPVLLTLPGPANVSWGYFLSQIWVIGLGGYMWPHLFLRMVATKSPRDARTVGKLIVFASVPSQIPVVLGALAAAILLPALVKPDTALLELVTKYAPVWVIGVLGAGGIAASLSTINSLAHCQGVLIARDFYTKFFNRAADERSIVIVSRLFVVLTSVIAYVAALTKPQFLWTILAQTYAGVIQFFPLTIAALFWPRATKQGAIAGLICGLIVAVGFSKVLNIAPFGIVPPAWGVMVNAAVLVIVSLMTQPVRALALDEAGS